MPPLERANFLTHLPGFLFGLVGLFLFLGRTDHWSVILFSFCFVLMFFASSMYHYVGEGPVKKKWRIVDHISIYGLIAGTYTPFIALYMNTSKGRLILLILWVCVGLGVVMKIFFTGKFRLVSTLIYLIMGWMAIFELNDFITYIPPDILFWIGLGGVFYTLGTLFYLWKKWPFHHAIWHVFVLAGAISHWVGVYRTVLLTFS